MLDEYKSHMGDLYQYGWVINEFDGCVHLIVYKVCHFYKGVQD